MVFNQKWAGIAIALTIVLHLLNANGVLIVPVDAINLLVMVYTGATGVAVAGRAVGMGVAVASGASEGAASDTGALSTRANRIGRREAAGIYKEMVE